MSKEAIKNSPPQATESIASLENVPAEMHEIYLTMEPENRQVLTSIQSDQWLAIKAGLTRDDLIIFKQRVRQHPMLTCLEVSKLLLVLRLPEQKFKEWIDIHKEYQACRKRYMEMNTALDNNKGELSVKDVLRVNSDLSNCRERMTWCESKEEKLLCDQPAAQAGVAIEHNARNGAVNIRNSMRISGGYTQPKTRK
jgi:hypothetical protein